ncbi:hypothetical protein ACFYNO_00015 [Kitasatospora sp. NPDC006697]|uniref:hypothetical protein n=1 Tax=Kitasatospora sp. NPDC006697 TaxID=3364020 RepID=UPI003675E689
MTGPERRLHRALLASGLPGVWPCEYEALRTRDAQQRGVRHAARSLARMPAGYRWGVTAALRLLPTAFWALTRHQLAGTNGPALRQGLARLRRTPGYAEVLRAVTALALFGALDGTPNSTLPGTPA